MEPSHATAVTTVSHTSCPRLPPSEGGPYRSSAPPAAICCAAIRGRRGFWTLICRPPSLLMPHRHYGRVTIDVGNVASAPPSRHADCDFAHGRVTQIPRRNCDDHSPPSFADRFSCDQLNWRPRVLVLGIVMMLYRLLSSSECLERSVIQGPSRPRVFGPARAESAWILKL